MPTSHLFRPRLQAMLCAACLIVGVAWISIQAPALDAAPPKADEVDDLGTRRSGHDWPGFLGLTGDSKSAETGIISPWPAAGPRLVWQKRLDTSYGMPSISRGRLVQFARRGDQAVVQCWQSETGEPLWEFDYSTNYEDLYNYENGPRTSPIVDGERVYVHGVEGELYCLNLADGSEIWNVDTVERFGVIQNFFGVGSTPVVEGDVLIVQVGGSPPESRSVPPGQLNRVKSNGTAVVAFDKLTGEVRYKIGDDLASYAGPAVATIDGRRWCFVLARGGLLGFEPAGGDVDFYFPWRAGILESVNASNPVVDGNRVFISETYGPGSCLLSVQPGKAEVVWSDADKRRGKSMQTHWNTAIHVDGYLYGSSGRHESNAELRCVELATGKVMWSEPGWGRSSLLYVDGHLICLTEYGELKLIMVDPEKLALVSELILEDPERPGTRLLRPPAWAAPILSHGLLYVRGRDRLACLELIPE